MSAKVNIWLTVLVRGRAQFKAGVCNDSRSTYRSLYTRLVTEQTEYQRTLVSCFINSHLCRVRHTANMSFKFP